MTTLLAKIQKQHPLVLNVANLVTMQRVADAINVVGASPLMTNEAAEAADLVNIAHAVTLNIGTVSENQFDLFVAAGQAANAQGKPVILDPVAVSVPFRGDFVRRLMHEVKIDFIRGNAAEIAWFSAMDVAGQGIDALDTNANVESAQIAAQKTGAVIVQTGVVDVVTDGKNTHEITYHSPLLAINVGAGDMVTGMLGAFAAVAEHPVDAGVAVVQTIGLAGEQASTKVAQLPGNFVGALMNELYQLAKAEVRA